MIVELSCEVMPQFLLERLELRFRPVVVSLEACHLYEVLEEALALAVIFESVVYCFLLESLIVGVRDTEGACWSNCWVFADIIDDILHHDHSRVESGSRQVIDDIG